MLKTIITLLRGRANARTDAFLDANALPILDQQLRDGALALTQAKRAVALAIAQQKQEHSQHAVLAARLKELEERAVQAIKKGENELASEAAGQIAILEDELKASGEAQTAFEGEIFKLRDSVRKAEERLRSLKRGHKVALATERTQKLRDLAPQSVSATLGEAEATLERLRARQREIDLTEEAIGEMDRENDPSRLVCKLADAGCGKALTTKADDVLERLGRKAGKAKLA